MLNYTLTKLEGKIKKDKYTLSVARTYFSFIGLIVGTLGLIISTINLYFILNIGE